jgi:hypothetical protein
VPDEEIDAGKVEVEDVKGGFESGAQLEGGDCSGEGAQWGI